MSAQNENGHGRRGFGEQLTFYHANRQGNGAAVRLEPRINRQVDDRYNCFFLEMARQKSVAQRGESGSRAATFDWENKITVKLGFSDVCELLAVLEGLADHVGGKREGLYHQNGDAGTVIRFGRHDGGGCALSLSRKAAGDDAPTRVGTILSQSECIGLMHIFQVGLFLVTFPTTWRGARLT